MAGRRLQWVAAGAVVRFASKRYAVRRIDAATEQLTDSLPTPLVRAVERLPGDLPRVGGAAIVASTSAAKVARSTVAVGKATGRATRRAGAVTAPAKDALRIGVAGLGQIDSARQRVAAERRGLADRLTGARFDLIAGIEDERRRRRSELLAETRGPSAALDALLDQRAAPDAPLPEVTEPIANGRVRARPELPEPPVDRVQRSYRRPVNDWDRPSRR